MNRLSTAVDFEKALNAEQYAAVTAGEGPLLVLAAAGTGKTRTLVYRLAWLAAQGVPPSRVLLLTFTNKAAREMLERAASLLTTPSSGIWGGTFHHLCNRLLRRHAERIGFASNYTILDRDDARSLVGRCVKDRKLNHREFPKPDVLLDCVSRAANCSRSVEAIIAERLDEADVDPDAVLKVLKDYAAAKQRLQSMDFDDLLVNGLRLFVEHAGEMTPYLDRFLHVLVDEYQDTNPVQASLVDRVAARHRNIMVVGDDFQSIYAWRGADFRNILSFPDRYADTRIIKLETNYRSVPEVLAVANACIRGNPDQFQKTLRATRSAYQRPLLAMVRDGGEQARFVVDQLRRLRREGYAPDDIAILYRAHYHAMELQMELTRERVAYTITSGVRFFEQAHIKDVLAPLRLVEHAGDELAFVRLLSLLPGVGERTALKLWQSLGGRLPATDEVTMGRITRALKGDAVDAWKAIARVMARYEPMGRHASVVLKGFVEAFYERHALNTFENAEQRLQDVDELITHADRFESTEALLSEVALMTNLDAEADAVDKQDLKRVRLSTIHQAKGLEWPAVIVLWMTEGMFPSPRSVQESADGEAEERRLFYVALTRAKTELCFCVPAVRRMRDGGVMPCEPSRFITELPPDLLRRQRAGFY